ncbi:MULTISPECIES: type VI secretion system baseplate subunit TssK [Pseudomonas]|uniref:type VI secretion system baseplate subunit TssK n=1 Tax=Pseudomonas TaxID=286 RepID=UPI001CE44D6A|nr:MULTISPECIES: type VI secretion system baseplate subunit TssK [Pseudomonas]MCO7594900.1 type VI secretion system baseplate subunit TssK [Pseudomonas guariconensis]MCO7634767.1 type VI secretion system baseplate subunit TssK [Pseudomonas guariconensis]MCU7221221.1 type VI secretion system baseplate subunit TssK [Pseudomonas brassicacearum]
MSSRNPVIWPEGLFVKPQHFQQAARASEAAFHQRLSSLNAAFYGFSELQLNDEYLSLGRIAITRARGIMPDGTVFDIPGDLPPPAPLEIDDDATQDSEVYLCLPLRTEGGREVSWPDNAANFRYVAQAQEIKDTHTADGDLVHVDLAVPNLQLKRKAEDSSAYTRLALARIREKRPDGSLQLDEAFYPTSVSLQAVPALKRFLDEITNTLRERARNLAARMGASGQSGVADIRDFNLLQAMNRWWPCFQHLARQPHTHPEQLYLSLSQACGELVTFTDENRLPQDYPAYHHSALHTSFKPLEQTLRRALSTVLQPRAISLALESLEFGVMTSTLEDRRLIDEADFILAVRASLPPDTLRQQFVQKAKVTSLQALNDLVPLQLPGIPLLPLPVAPRELPFHAGFSYFELDRRNPAWQAMQGSNGFGFHIAGDFPGLELQFWAIRSE